MELKKRRKAGQPSAVGRSKQRLPVSVCCDLKAWTEYKLEDAQKQFLLLTSEKRLPNQAMYTK